MGISMFVRRCLFLLAILCLLTQAQAQANDPQAPVCNTIGLEQKVDVLIQQNSNLRQQIADQFDQNKVTAIISESISARMAEATISLHNNMLILFVGLAMLVCGIVGISYWFAMSKVKKVINNA